MFLLNWCEIIKKSFNLFTITGDNSSAPPTSDGKYVPPSRRGNAAPSTTFSGRSHRGKYIQKQE